ncbi:uncharacterized protein LOC120129461 [Hibiscus syriacus]|uniref:uncharacterized protein LOC120129461 n=1 Tax=Hibiscus syriacus TaxID=106335 RepID=UPI001923E569|nr:uncharacterized protein LOC120129461 [Hibiscus syriacus]
MNAPSKVGPPISTEVYLNNRTDQDFGRLDKIDWCGTSKPPVNVPSQQTRYFMQLADSFLGCSEGGLVFVVNQDIKWVVAWSNTLDDNKVYTEITKKETIEWDKIKEKLEKSTSNVEVTDEGYKSTVDIDPYSVKPNVNAKLEDAPAA